MSKSTLPIGAKVRRLASTSDYTNGRQGEIVEINNLTQRYRVRWTHEASGSRISAVGVRTWVKFNAVAAI